MEIKDMFAPASDQMDAVDLIDAPRTLTVKDANPGPSDQQPLNVHFSDFPRPWRPNKGMGRILKKLWGTDTTKWAGRSITLYYEPEVWFGKEKTGGVRISHMSNIDKAETFPVRERGAVRPHTVNPLRDVPRPAPTPTDPTPAQIAAATTPDELRALWESSSKSPEMSALVKARKAEMDGGAV